MPQTYATYTNISVNALEFNPKSQDLIQKKQEIMTALSDHYKCKPASILFVGFSPLILGTTGSITVSNIDNSTKNYLDSQNIKYTYVNWSDIDSYYKKFDWVVASDEYFTFASTEEEQRINIEKIADLTKSVLITTLKDYKNQDFKDREFSQPLAVYNQKDSMIFLEHHQTDFSDKNLWSTTVYELQGNKSQMYGPFARRSMFFKQMAKFSMDAGAKNFLVHKNLMYKSLIKKNYEHVISISF